MGNLQELRLSLSDLILVDVVHASTIIIRYAVHFIACTGHVYLDVSTP